MSTVAVVIPFFQRARGILTRCLESVAAQNLPDDASLLVLVVDDGSPLPAAMELENWQSCARVRIEILRQANGGPAAARNRALDAIPGDVQFVAFVDSDDTWRPGHVGQALEALDATGDFYFCDSELAPGHTEFQRLPPFRDAVAEGRFEPLSDRPSVFAIPPGEAADLIARHYVAHTSTVVYRFSAMRNLRFADDLRYGAEDHLMWVQVACQARSVRFSTMAFSVRGEGVNMYRDSLDRVSMKNIRREACRIRAFRRMGELPNISERAAKAAREKRDETLTEIVAIVLRPSGLRAACHSGAQPFMRHLLRDNWRLLLLAAMRLLRHRRAASPVSPR